MNEIWKTINGYYGKYEISNMGRVRKTGRLYSNSKNKGILFYDKPILLKPFDNGSGYKIICLHDGKKRKNQYIHRLVAEYFIDNPDKKDYVNHIDYNRSNNCFTNLEWCSVQENINHSLPNMCGYKKNVPTNTEHRYICKRKDKERYRVSFMVDKKEKEKNFNSLEKALEFRKTIYGF